MKVSDDAYRAIQRLCGDSDFREFIEFLNYNLNEQLHRNLYLTGEELLKGLGRGLCLVEILKVIQQAEDRINQD